VVRLNKPTSTDENDPGKIHYKMIKYKIHYEENHLDPKARPIHPYLMPPRKRLSKNTNETKKTSLSSTAENTAVSGSLLLLSSFTHTAL